MLFFECVSFLYRTSWNFRVFKVTTFNWIRVGSKPRHFWISFFFTSQNMLLTSTWFLCNTKKCNKFHSSDTIETHEKLSLLRYLNRHQYCVCWIYLSLHILDGLLSETLVTSTINVNIPCRVAFRFTSFLCVFLFFPFCQLHVTDVSLDKNRL